MPPPLGMVLVLVPVVAVALSVLVRMLVSVVHYSKCPMSGVQGVIPDNAGSNQPAFPSLTGGGSVPLHTSHNMLFNIMLPLTCITMLVSILY